MVVAVDARNTTEHTASYARDIILMPRDTMFAIQRVFNSREDKVPRSGALLRLLRCLDVGRGQGFHARHVAGVEKLLRTACRDESQRRSTTTSARSGPTFHGADRYRGQRASRATLECW